MGWEEGLMDRGFWGTKAGRGEGGDERSRTACTGDPVDEEHQAWWTWAEDREAGGAR